jgi:hypothetical protein
MSFWNVTSTKIEDDQVYVNNTYKNAKGNNALTTITASNSGGYTLVNSSSTDPIVKKLAYSIQNDGKISYIISGSNTVYNSIQGIIDAKLSGYTPTTTALIKNEMQLNLNTSVQTYNTANPTKPIGPKASSGGGGKTQPPLGPVGTNPDIEPFSGAELTVYTDKQGFFANSKAILKYPLKQSSEIYDYIKIQPVEYVAGFNIGQAPTAQIESVTTRIKNTGLYPTIFLPMTPSISETNSVGWGSDELNPVQIAFGQAAMNAIGSVDGNINLDTIKNALGGISGAAINLTSQSGLSKFISAYFAGQAVGANLLGRTGIVINPNLELLFQGPKLRSFRYNFRFTPRDDEEAKEIRRIIRVFKKSMAPRRTEGSLFLGVPAVYEIKYIFKENRDHPFLNKIKPCALTGFNVNYAPDGSYMTYQDGSMTSYTVDMQFDELEPIYNEDISQDLESETMDY